MIILQPRPTHSSPYPGPNPKRQLPNLPNLPTYLSSPSTCPGYRDILALQHLEDKALYVKLKDKLHKHDNVSKVDKRTLSLSLSISKTQR